MKRFLTLILALCLVLSLAACGGDSTSTTAAKTEAPATTEAATTEAPVTTTEAPVTTTEAPVTTTEAPATTEASESALHHGKVEKGVYTNESLNIRLEAPKGWIFYSDEQIAAQNNLTVEFLEGTDLAETIQKNGQMMDMMVQSTTDGSNANLMIQPAQAALNLYSDEQLYTLLEETYRAQMGAAGMEISSYEVEKFQALGEERDVLKIGIKMNDVELTEYQIWLRESTEYYGILTFTSLGGSEPQEFFDLLTRLN